MVEDDSGVMGLMLQEESITTPLLQKLTSLYRHSSTDFEGAGSSGFFVLSLSFVCLFCP